MCLVVLKLSREWINFFVPEGCRNFQTFQISFIIILPTHAPIWVSYRIHIPNKIISFCTLRSLLKVAQINYISRNQLHCTANLNFGLMCKKAKHCWALSTNLVMFCFLLNVPKNSNSSKYLYDKVILWKGTSGDLSYVICMYYLFNFLSWIDQIF